MPRRRTRGAPASAAHSNDRDAVGPTYGILSDPDGAARQLVIRQLTQAPRTRAQLASTLIRRGFPEATVERVLDRFSELQLIDDEAFAQAWVESRHVGRGLARRLLAHELRVRGVADETVDAALANLSTDQEVETARALVRRRLRATTGEATDVRIRRAVGALARRGYSASLAFRLVREELDAEGTHHDTVADTDDWDDDRL